MIELCIVVITLILAIAFWPISLALLGIFVVVKMMLALGDALTPVSQGPLQMTYDPKREPLDQQEQDELWGPIDEE